MNRALRALPAALVLAGLAAGARADWFPGNGWGMSANSAAVLYDVVTPLAVSTPTYPSGPIAVQPNFDWIGPSTGVVAALGAGASYILQASASPSFASLAVSISTPAVVASTSSPFGTGVYVSTYALSPGTYYWRVAAINGLDNNQSPWSSVSTFTYDAASPSASGFASVNSTGGAAGEAQWNNLASGVTVQIAVSDALTGLAVSSSALLSSGDGHDGPGSTGGYGVMYTTNAGQSWIDAATVSGLTVGASIYALAVFNGKLYAGDVTGKVYSSADGATWTAGTAVGVNINALTVFNGRLYAVGWNGETYSSADGATWTAAPPAGGSIYALAVFNGKLYAGDATGKVYSSADGAAWTAGTVVGGKLYALAVFNGKLYAGDVTGKVYSSADGATWTAGTAVGVNINALTVFNGKLYAGDNNNGEIYSSADGATWTTGTTGGRTYGLTVFNGRLYAGDYINGKVYSSADGATWTAGTAVGGSIYALAVFNGKLYAGDHSNGKVYQIAPVTAALTGSDGTTGAQALTATSLNFAASTNAVVCGGVSPCGATNQVLFTASDMAGNVRAAGPYAVITDTIAPTATMTSLAPTGTSSLLADAAGQGDLASPVSFNFEASSSPAFAFSVSSSGFLSTTYYQFAGLLPATTYYVRATARDLIGNVGAPSTALSTQTLAAVAWTAIDVAPVGVFQSSEAAVLRFTLASPNGTATFRKLLVTRVGGADADVSEVRVYLDANGNGVFDPSDSLLGQNFLTAGGALVDLAGSAQTIGPAGKTFFVVYQVAPQATVGDRLSAVVQVSSQVVVDYPYGAAGSFPAASGYTAVLDGPNLLSVSTQAVAPASAPPGTSNIPMIALNMNANGGTSIVRSLVAYVNGSLPSNQISSVRVYRDTNGNGVLDAGDALVTSGVDVFTAGVATLTFTAGASSRTVAAAPAKFFVTVSLSPAAPAGDAFAVSLASASELVLDTFLDTVSYSAAPIVSSTVTVVTNNALTASLAGGPPAAMSQGVDYQVAAATLTVDVGVAGITRLSVNRTGTGADADVSAVKVYVGQPADNGAYNPATDNLAGSAVFSGGVATVNLTTVPVTAGATTVLFVVYSIAPGANAGDTLGAGFSNSGYLQANNALTVVSGNFPFKTSTGTVLATVNTLQIASIDQSPGSLLQGATNVSLLRVQLWTDRNSLKLSSLALNRLGGGLDGDVSAVSIWRDVDGNGLLSTSTDALVSSGSDLLPMIGTTTIAFALPQTITPSTATYFVAVSVSPNAAPGNTLGVRVSSSAAFGVNAPNVVSTAAAAFPLTAGPTPIAQYPNVVSVSTASLTPLSGAAPGAQNVAVLRLALNANVSSAQWLSLRVDRGGSSSDADAANVKVWYDVNQIGSFNPANLGQYALVTSSALTFGSQGTPGSVVLGFNAPQGLTTAAKTFFLTVDVASAAAPGDAIVARAIDQSYFSVNAPNGVAPTSFSAAPLAVIAPPSLLQAVAYSSAPASAIQGSANVVMESLGLWMRAYTGQVSQIAVSRTGGGQDADVSRVRLYLDSNANGVLDVGTDVELATAAFSGGTAVLAFAPLTVTASTRTLFVAYDVAPAAAAGDTLGASVPTPGSILIASPNSVSALGFPLASSATLIVPTENGVSISYQDRAPAGLLQASTNVLLLSLTMNTTSQAVPLSALAFNRAGTASDSDIARLSVYLDAVGDGVFRPGSDPRIASAASPFVGGRALASLSPVQSITPPPAARYFVAVDVADFATPGATFGLTLASTASVTVAAPNTVVNANFPMSSSPVPIVKIPDALTLTPSSLLTADVIQGSLTAAIGLSAFSSRQSSVWTKLRLGRTGTLADSLIASVAVYRDMSGSGAIDPSDPLVGTGTFSAGVASISFSSAQTVGVATQTYLAVLQLDPNATVGATLGLTLADASAFTIASPDSASSPSLPFQTALVSVLDAHTPARPAVSLSAGAYTSDFEQIAFVWSSTVAIGSLASAQYAIGTSPGGTQARAWTALSPVPGAALAGGLLLMSGSTYYVTVQATSSSGFASVPGVSPGLLVDTVVPGKPGALNAVVGQSSVVLSWAPAFSGPSGLRGYLVEYMSRSRPVWINGLTGSPSGLAGLSPAPNFPASVLTSSAPVALSGLPAGTLSFRATAVGSSGLLGAASDPVTVQFGPLSAASLANAAVFPNPVDARKGSATIVFDLPAPADVVVRVFTLFGAKVREFSVAGQAGTNSAAWDATGDGGGKLPKGVYILVLESGGATVKLKAGVIH